MFIRLDQQMFYSRPSVSIYPVIFTAIFWSSSTASCPTKSTRCLPSSAFHEKGKSKTFSLKNSVTQCFRYNTAGK